MFILQQNFKFSKAKTIRNRYSSKLFTTFAYGCDNHNRKVNLIRIIVKGPQYYGVKIL